MKITIVGAGYVGLSNAFLMGLKRNVTVVDIDKSKIMKLKTGEMIINDEYIKKYKEKVNVHYSINFKKYYENSDIIFIAINTDYNLETNSFDISNIESTIKKINDCSTKSKIIVIKSTIPVGYTEDLQLRYTQHTIIFSPEFLRESYALYDNLYPDRIVIGGEDKSKMKIVSDLLKESILSIEETPIVYTSTKEAEVTKLFTNTYLAMRVSFVNELDTFCQTMKLNTKDVLDSMGYDHRIGRYYLNPSFGYGGYCLPKDSKQLKEEYNKKNIDSSLVPAIVESNEKRKLFIAKEIMKNVLKNQTIGIYRLISKKGINNYRNSSIIDIIKIMKNNGYDIIIYDFLIEDKKFNGVKVENNFEEFIEKSSIIVANRIDDKIKNFENVYSVDVYNEN